MEIPRFEPRDPEYRSRVNAIFGKANFIRELGCVLESVEPGCVKTSLIIRDAHLQQNRFVHAGVMATLADHTAGCAGGSLLRAGDVVLTIEYKANFLRPCVGESLSCTAEVFHLGRTIITADSWVLVKKGSRERLAAKAVVTLAVVSGAYE